MTVVFVLFRFATILLHVYCTQNWDVSFWLINQKRASGLYSYTNDDVSLGILVVLVVGGYSQAKGAIGESREEKKPRKYKTQL